MNIDPVEFGELRAKVAGLESRCASMDEKLEELIALANKGKGGFWAGMLIVSAISSLVGWVAHWFTVSPK